MKRKAITPDELEREYGQCLRRERKRYREWAKTRQGAFETYQVLHFDAEAEEAREREHSTSWLSDRGRGAAVIRRFGNIARPQDDPDTRKKRINRARMAIIRHMPECLETFWLIIRNGKNRKESIWQLMKSGTSKKARHGMPQSISTVHSSKKC